MHVGIKNILKKQPGIVFIIYASLASFLTYSCMYAFRKPFTAATYGEIHFLGVHLKIWLIFAQVLGYTVSKFIGIKFVSGINEKKRAISILLLIGIAELSLFFFAITPIPYKIIFLFFNGLPLGIIWGLVFSYLEGRRYTELLGAVLSASFIFSSGFVKTIGSGLMVYFHVGEFWMPFVTGLIFALPLVLFVWLLNQVPGPSAHDVSLRTKRVPMNNHARKVFFNKFAFVIVILTSAYILLTVFREMRDNYAAEIWASLGKGGNPEIFTLSEIPVGITVLVVMAMVSLIKNNQKALGTILFMVMIGFVVIGLSSLFFSYGKISGGAWVVLTGLGLYMGYVPFNALLFERMIAAFSMVSNIGFVMYIADSFGYLGSIMAFIVKNFFSPELSWIDFFVQSSYFLAVAGVVFTMAAIWWFRINLIKNKY